MRFVFVITNLVGGGAEKVVLTLADALSRRGHATQIVLLEDRVQHQVPSGVHIVTLGQRLARGWFGKRLLARRLRRQIHAGEAPDMVVSALPFANEVAILANLPNHWCRIDNSLGAEVEQLARSNPGKARRRLARYRRLYHLRPLVAVSAGVADDLRTTIKATGRIEQIPNPFDLDAIRTASEICDPDLPKAPYVIHAGRFNRQKRHDILLDAWQLVATEHMLVLLTEPDQQLQEMIDQRSLTGRVRIAGFKGNPYPWMAAADLLVLSSDHEGLGNVLIEALACGTRVVSTDCPSGPSEILVGELARWLVPPGDPERLAAAIHTALGSPRPSAAVVEAALAPYSATGVLDAWERLAATEQGSGQAQG